MAEKHEINLFGGGVSKAKEGSKCPGNMEVDRGIPPTHWLGPHEPLRRVGMSGVDVNICKHCGCLYVDPQPTVKEQADA